MRSKTVYLSLGSNLGEREVKLKQALEALEREQVRVIARSSVYETAPRDVLDQPWFLNMVVACETERMPLQLMHLLLRIEAEAGRARKPGNKGGPRALDLDILLFGNVVIHAPLLTVPHPRMTERRFVLEPLLEIAPDLRHPATHEPLKKYLAETMDQQVRIKR